MNRHRLLVLLQRWSPCLLASLVSACVGPVTASEVTVSEPSPHEHHAIDYLEIAVTDMDAAKQFYTAAFGWQFNDYGPEYAGIRAKEEGREAGGLRLDAKVVRGGPLIILYSSDLESSMQSVKDAGGEICVDILEFPGGRRFQFLDPSGNELAVWSDK